jgi:hypothetical protein
MNFIHLTLYAVTTAVLIIAEHYTFGRWWKRNEIARRTMGHVTILLLAALFVPSGLIQLETLIAITIATGAAGAIIGSIHVYETEQHKNQRAAAAREAIKQYDTVAGQ